MKYIDKKLIVSTIIVAIILAFVLIEQCKYIKISDNDLVEIQEKFDYYEKKKFRKCGGNPRLLNCRDESTKNLI